MYRIDENTYIDDSLVTCAEYQLFIDEMCEQGQFFQPDHWTCYQFPAGQAHTPILGVRPSDAKAFCEWLSGREDGEWRFRLPSADEAAQYPIQKHVKRPNGFWTQDGNEHSFAWIGPALVDARALARARAIARKFDADFARALELDFSIEIKNLDLDRAKIFGIGLARIRTLDLDLKRARTRTLDIDYIRTLDPAFVLALDRYRACASNFGVDFDLARAHALARAISLERSRALDWYVDILTLQERIAGRSPAFEGIRLVKERKAE